jgi:hypothetical protein
MQCEKCRLPLWKAGEIVPAGTYARVDDDSYRLVRLDREGPLPATFDGHTAWYCPAARPCARRERAKQPVATSHTPDQGMERPSAPVSRRGESDADR